MAPLVPDLIGNELNLLMAFIIGIAFGFILEQAGFSSSKKLVGLFYGYDFTVLRVFFTAGITAMVGIIIFTHYGLLDINLVYINPTFVWSAIAGGIIMGLGFVVGGFCPGTSFCAAAIGKIDALFFIGGSFIGVFIFAETYPLLEQFYKSGSYGFVRLFETLSLSQGVFALILVIVAVAAFWGTTLLEKHNNGKLDPQFSNIKLYTVLSIIAIAVGFSTLFFPEQKIYYTQKVDNNDYTNNYNIRSVTSDELAYRIINTGSEINLIDLRDQKEIKENPLPYSYHYSLSSLFEKDAKKILLVRNKLNIFIAEDELSAKKGAVIADQLGYVNPAYLIGGYNSFRTDILDFNPPASVSGKRDIDKYRFRAKAASLLPEIIKKAKETPVSQPKSKRILGGC